MGYLRTGLRTVLLPYRAHVRQAQRFAFPVVLGAVLVLGVHAAYAPDHVARLRAQEAELRRLEAMNAEAAERNERLKAQLLAMQRDPQYVVHLARKDLGLVRPGEVVYEFEQTEAEVAAPPDETDKEADQ